jgi:hypothetical protein
MRAALCAKDSKTTAKRIGIQMSERIRVTAVARMTPMRFVFREKNRCGRTQCDTKRGRGRGRGMRGTEGEEGGRGRERDLAEGGTDGAPASNSPKEIDEL